MQCCHSVIQLLGSPLAINFWLKITIMPITCTLNHIISIFCHYTVIVITSVFHELPCQRDESPHQWQFWLHENYKCSIVCWDNEWAREAILWFLNWFLWMTKEDGVWAFCKWMDSKLIVSTKLTNVHRQSSSIFLFLWFGFAPHMASLFTKKKRKSVFILARIWDPRLLEERYLNCVGNVESSSCYTGTVASSLLLGTFNKDGCSKCSSNK